MNKESGGNPLAEYQSACLNFAKYLDGKKRGYSSSQNSEMRRVVCDLETYLYGDESLFKALRDPYIAGYGVIVSTLKTLEKLKVHTKVQLIEFDEDTALQHSSNFGPEKVKVVKFLRDIFITEANLKNQ